MEDPGGEIEASERRLCCVTKHTKINEKKKKIEERMQQILRVFITLFYPESPLCPCCLLA